MSDLNHRFQAGKMNKDLDERLVPNGEYRDALNVQVATSDSSDIGSLQNIMGNLDISSSFFIDPVSGFVTTPSTLETYGFYCVGSILDEKTDRLYWLVSGKGIDFIAEYDYNTKIVSPIVVDVFRGGAQPGQDGRVLSFDKSYLITGINIIEETLFWTDNNTEPKRINISQTRIGTTDFFTHTKFWVPNPDPNIIATVPYVEVGDLKQEHVTVVKKGPKTAPRLEMKNTTRGNVPGSGLMVGEIATTWGVDPSNPADISSWWDTILQVPITSSSFTITLDTDPDLKEGDMLVLDALDLDTNTLRKTKIIVEIVSVPTFASGRLTCDIQVLSWDVGINVSDSKFNVTLQQDKPLFEFRFPRFAYRYKYKDGEYSCFSPFTEVAFLPGNYDYLPKEGYNLGMVNTIRTLGVCDFVDENSIPDDVVSIDILYKESNSPNIYSIKSVDRVIVDTTVPTPKYESWNAVSALKVRDTTVQEKTHGYVDIKAEMIHSILPSNQLLRGWDNVPRKALAQEVIGNRLVYANYLQNYNVSSSMQKSPSALRRMSNVISTLKPEKHIDVDVSIGFSSQPINENLLPEQLDSGTAFSYRSAKTVKSLRTYQLGVVYIDEFGRETPVFSGSKKNANTVVVPKSSAPQQTKLTGQIFSPNPDFAKNFKFLIKETSSEYYNLAMDRWYPAEDGNIWLSFPSSDRNKVDLETFLILKKAHESDTPITDLAKYKILDIENEAPRFIKTKRTPVRTITDGFFNDGTNDFSIFMNGTSAAPGYTNTSFPFTGKTFIDIIESEAKTVETIYNNTLSSSIDAGGTRFQFRMISVEGASDWYDLKSVEQSPSNQEYLRFRSTKPFGADMSITTGWDVDISPSDPAYQQQKIEFITKQEKNLPEFEGRFFVKILKDAALQEHILGYQQNLPLYSPIKQIKSQYINPMHPDVANGGLYDNATNSTAWYGIDQNLISIDQHNLDTKYHIDEPAGRGQSYWELAARTNNPNSQSSGWFIDKIEGFRMFKHNYHYYDSDRDNYNYNDTGWPYSLNGPYGRSPHHSSTVKTHNDPYPTGGAMSATSSMTFSGNFPGYKFGYPKRPQQMMQLTGDGTNHITGLQAASGLHNDYLGFEKAAQPLNSINVDYPGDSLIRSVDTAKYGKILPGIGVDGKEQGNTSLITLSYAGISDAQYPFPARRNFSSLNLVNSYFSTGSWAGDYVDEVEFITSITTPGTIWRWKEDPDQVVYQTLPGPSPATTVTQSEWNANQTDVGRDNELGVELYNYTHLCDYAVSCRIYNTVSLWGWMIEEDAFHIQTMASMGVREFGKDWNTWIAADTVIGTAWLWLVTTWHKNTWAKNVKEHHDRLALPMGTPLGSLGKNESDDGNRWPMYTGSWDAPSNKRRRFTIHCGVLPIYGRDKDAGIGGVGPHKYSPTNDPKLPAHFDHNGDVLTTVPATPAPGIRPDGMYSGRTGVVGTYTVNSTVYSDGKIPKKKVTDASGNESPAPGTVTWQILEPYVEDGLDEGYFSQNPGVWETEPKEDLGLEIYHEVGQIYPTELNEETIEQFFGPIHPLTPNPGGGIVPLENLRNSRVTCTNSSIGLVNLETGGPTAFAEQNENIRIFDYSITNSGKVYIKLCDVNKYILNDPTTQTTPAFDDTLTFTRADGSSTSVLVKDDSLVGTLGYEVYIDTHNYKVTLPWFNAYSFSNGVESNRVRDDYNQVTIDKGPKVSAVLEEPYREEHRSSGFIWSGIYNSMSGVNNLNQFIQAEKITKDLNPSHGSIQKLFARNTDLVTLCEDKVFKILANKDALYNADGNANLTATENVLGQTIPFAGDYGISKNPESVAADAYRLYFSDRTRGNILRLSQDGITSVSNYGMMDWFADNLPNSSRIIGSFDDKKKEYNVSLDYTDYNTYSVGILGQNVPTLQDPSVTVVTPNYIPTNTLTARYDVANKIHINDEVFGPGIPTGSIVTSKENVGGGEWKIHISQIPTINDVGILGNYINYGVHQIGVFGDVIWQTRIYSSKKDADLYTLSYSEAAKGWPSFKSFYPENGLSLNNEYFTFKEGQLHQHHANDKHNEFYGEYSESSVEFLFNEIPGSVKSFQTINYEGTQSKVVSDGGLDDIGNRELANSEEYWDNYDKLGWYIDNMYTNLQEVEPAEFKDKEGKWFSTVQGISTEWLDDGKAGNIDTSEFSYQGIDEANTITIEEGGYTSWNCSGVGYGGDCCVDPLTGNPIPIYSTTFNTGNNSPLPVMQPITNNLVAPSFVTDSLYELIFNNNSLIFSEYVFEFSDGVDTVAYHFCAEKGGGEVIDASVYPNSTIQFNDLYNNPLPLVNGLQPTDTISVVWAGYNDENSYDIYDNVDGSKDYVITCTSADYLVDWFKTYIDSSAFSIGMSWSSFQAALGGNQALGNFLSTYNTFNPNAATGLAGEIENLRVSPRPCEGGGRSYNACVEVPGLDGVYSSKDGCLQASNSPCNPTCQTLNEIDTNTINGVPLGISTDCFNGTISVETILNTEATSWTVRYEDLDGNVMLVDSVTYAINGWSAPKTLPNGEYKAIVEDNLGCISEKIFTISCDAPPCDQSPGDFEVTIKDPTWLVDEDRCWRSTPVIDPNQSVDGGSIKFENILLTSPSTSWGYEVYQVISGVATLIDSMVGLFATDVQIVTGLEEGDYYYIITDNTGCNYDEQSFKLHCIEPCSSLVTVKEETIIDATSIDDCNTDNSNGSHAIQLVVLPVNVTSYTVQYYSYPSTGLFAGPTHPSSIPIGSLQGPFTSVSNANASIGSISGLASSSVSGNNYAVVLTDDQGCENWHQFTVRCTGITCDTTTNPSSSYAIQPATSNDCDTGDNGDGQHVIQFITLQPAATSFTIEYFWVDLSGSTPVPNSLSSAPLVVFSASLANQPLAATPNGGSNLTASANKGTGYYMYTITDNLGCFTSQSFHIYCTIP